MHLLLDHDGYLPSFVHISDGLCHEVKIAQELDLPKGSIVAIDRGYCDYELFQNVLSHHISKCFFRNSNLAIFAFFTKSA